MASVHDILIKLRRDTITECMNLVSEGNFNTHSELKMALVDLKLYKPNQVDDYEKQISELSKERTARD